MAAAAPPRPGLIFYLGTHEAHWLARMSIPLCVSRNRLIKRVSLPAALGPWMLDSGGFTELQRHGQWTIPARQYAAEVRRFADEIGYLTWAAPQDWMCEPAIINGGIWHGQRFAGTGLTVSEHQRRTTANYLDLRMIAPDLPFRPVLQGDAPDDYLRHADLYEQHGISLAAEPLVGVGSVCRLQATGKADWIIRSLTPLRMHGFGVKITGLLRYGDRLASADSLAWSYDARRDSPLPGCRHASCASCATRAQWWRQRLLSALAAAERRGRQGDLFECESVPPRTVSRSLTGDRRDRHD